MNQTEQSAAVRHYEKKAETARQFKKGFHDGIPICLGYLAVSFALGILAAESGMTATQSTVTSILVLASAGQYAGFTLVGAGGSYLGMAGVIFVANMRYMLMSASLSQKVSPDMKFFHRFVMAWGITDEIFGIGISQPGRLSPFYHYGAMAIAVPGWAIGTCLGVLVGNVLPADLVSALSIGLYGMFIAIIIPPAKKSRIIALLIVISMVASYLFSKAPLLSNLSDGNRTIILTIVIAGIAALLFPVKEEAEAGGAETGPPKEQGTGADMALEQGMGADVALKQGAGADVSVEQGAETEQKNGEETKDAT